MKSYGYDESHRPKILREKSQYKSQTSDFYCAVQYSVSWTVNPISSSRDSERERLVLFLQRISRTNLTTFLVERTEATQSRKRRPESGEIVKIRREKTMKMTSLSVYFLVDQINIYLEATENNFSII